MPPSSWKARIASHRVCRASTSRPGGRLVEEHQPGPADERQRHRQPAPLPAGEPTGLPSGQVGEAEPVEQLAPGHRVGVVRGDEVDAPRRPAASPGRPVSCGVTPICRRLAGSRGSPPNSSTRPELGRRRPDQQVDQGALAGAVRPEQADQLTGPDVQVDAVEGEDVAVPAAGLVGAGEDHDCSFTRWGRAGRGSLRCTPRTPAGRAG